MEWVKAEDMSVGDSVFTPIIPPETNNEIGIVYGDVDSGDYDTDERLLINENISFMLGFLSGDSVTFKRDKTKVELFIESHTKQSVFSKLLYILESNQFPHEVDYNGGYSKIKVVLNDYKFAAIVDTLFFYPEAPFEEKAMSEISYAMNHASLRLFITGYLESSGYFDNKKEAYVVSTASLAIVDDLILLCTRLGCSFKIEEINGKAWSIEVGYWNDVVLSSEETGIMIEHKIVGINTVPKNKVSVYDLEVEEDHSYTTTNFIVHNSAAGSLISFALGITNIDPIPYNLMFSRYLSAGRAKYPLIEFDGYPLSDWNHG
jgi:intein/homing endonuclease